MDRHGERQSSLPTSLIPHLYAAPRDGSSRSLPDADDRQLPPFPSQTFFYQSSRPTMTNTLPPLASLSASIFPPWREGDARRSSSQPARVISHPNPSFGYPSHRQDAGYYPTFASQSAPISSMPPLPPLQYLSSVEPPSFDRSDSYSYPQVGSLSISGSSPPNYLRPFSAPEHEPSYGSESLSVDNERDDAHKDKKRRAHSMDTDNIPKKSSRKTAVACNFCRGRKLRCNGAKPSCYNCTVRKFDCEYVSTQRRRGPGKAPKGSRSRKGRSEHSGSSSHIIGDRLLVPDFEVSPDLRPYTSVISLDTFEFQPPEPSSQYPSDRRHEPLMMGHDSRSRTTRSQETNLEDPSDAKHRNQPGS